MEVWASKYFCHFQNWLRFCWVKTYNKIKLIPQYIILNRAIKRQEQRSLENSLNEAIADSSLDTPVLPKPGKPYPFFVWVGIIDINGTCIGLQCQGWLRKTRYIFKIWKKLQNFSFEFCPKSVYFSRHCMNLIETAASICVWCCKGSNMAPLTR